MGEHKSWTVRANNTEHEGRSVWDNCPFKKGLEVYLHVMDLPGFAMRIGSQKARNKAANPGKGPLVPPLADLELFENQPLIKRGPYPGTSYPLTVGCNLNIIPAWEASGRILFAASTPAPTDGSNEGVDCRTVPELEIWANASNVDEFIAWPWVRHPTGQWAIPGEFTTPSSAGAHRFLVSTLAADRVYIQATFTTSITGPGSFAYGRLTAAVQRAGKEVDYDIEPVFVRFGAVQAPKSYQTSKRGTDL